MRSVNKVIIIGNLTRDPEIKETSNNQKVTTFGLATNREWMTSDGERKKSTEFHECVAWAHLAEVSEKYLRKGKLVYIEGYLKTRSWEGDDGAKRFKTEIVLQDMIMLEKKQRDDEDDEISSDTDSSATSSENKEVAEPAPMEEPSDDNLF
ncbi:single-stranded DNA-binding protein [Patescibacteria group bacterium]|nr:single-stranded DNA-binding protein [Patescibacteria group bacterium]